jgi:5-methylcytosine-specific restriction endonuclease McrA
MPRKKTNIVWTTPKEDLQSLLNKSSSLREVLNKLGKQTRSGGNYDALRNRIVEDELDMALLQENRRKQKKNSITRTKQDAKPLRELLVQNGGKYSKKHLKKRILEAGLLEYKCALCGIGPEWNNQPLTLQMDHINGNNSDDRLENLRILCPNCHTQTHTYAGKNQQYHNLSKSCIECGAAIFRTATRCQPCQAKLSNPKKFDPTKEELEDLLIKQDLSYTSIAKQFGVTGNTIKKRAKKLGIILPCRRMPNGCAIWNKTT